MLVGSRLKSPEKKEIVFKGCIKEKTRTGIGDTMVNQFKCTAILENSMIAFKKRSYWLGLPHSEKKIFYSSILDIDYENHSIFSKGFIQLQTKNSLFILWNKNGGVMLKNFYNGLISRLDRNNFSRAHNIQNINKSNNYKSNRFYSSANDLMDWHCLKERGIITPEEYEIKKKQLLYSCYI